jgi:hypothetical protein
VVADPEVRRVHTDVAVAVVPSIDCRDVAVSSASCSSWYHEASSSLVDETGASPGNVNVVVVAYVCPGTSG